MRITLPHVVDFSEDHIGVGPSLLSPEAWDVLRTSPNAGPFLAPTDRPALEAAADANPEVRDRMRAVNALLRKRGVEHLVSYGVGTGVPELWLLRHAPHVRLTVTEYAPATIAALRQSLPEATVLNHDLTTQEPVPGADLHLFHRIDTELDDDQWRETFGRFRTQTVVVVATGVMSLRRVLQQRRILQERRDATHAGWMRTRGAFEVLWRATHRQQRLRFHDLDGWLLEPRQARRPGAH